MSLAGCQINPINVNFHLQKSLEIFDKNSADKVWSKKDKGWKVPSLMPIRVNGAMLHNLDREKKLALHYQSTYTVYLPAQMT